MAVSTLLSIGLPVGLLLIVRKKFGFPIPPMIFGIAGFILFALVLESILHRIVLQPNADGTIALRSQPFLYTLYVGLAAGIFEETARFIAFLLLKKKQKKESQENAGIQTALSYGIGHGGVEAILLVGLSMINNLVLSVMINANLTQSLGDAPLVTAAIDSLIQTPSFLFLVGGLERIAAMGAQLSLSLWVWSAVFKRGKMWMYPAAIFLHALIDVPAALYQVGTLPSVALVEIFTFAAVGLLVWLTVRAYNTIFK
jgi:uncharacterized membrane protein YhfC